MTTSSHPLVMPYTFEKRQLKNEIAYTMKAVAVAMLLEPTPSLIF